MADEKDRSRPRSLSRFKASSTVANSCSPRPGGGLVGDHQAGLAVVGSREHHQPLLAGIEHERVFVDADVQAQIVEHLSSDEAPLPAFETKRLSGSSPRTTFSHTFISGISANSCGTSSMPSARDRAGVEPRCTRAVDGYVRRDRRARCRSECGSGSTCRCRSGRAGHGSNPTRWSGTRPSARGFGQRIWPYPLSSTEIDIARA